MARPHVLTHTRARNPRNAPFPPWSSRPSFVCAIVFPSCDAMEPPYTQEYPEEELASTSSDESDEEYVPSSQNSFSSDEVKTQPLDQDDELALAEARELQRRKRATARAKRAGSPGHKVVKVESVESSSIFTAEESPPCKRKREEPETTPDTDEEPTAPKQEPVRRRYIPVDPASSSRSMASRTMSMGPQRGGLVIDLSGTDTDPIAAHVTMNRVCNLVGNRAAATQKIVSALETMSTSQTKIERSALPVVGPHWVRSVLRGLVDMDPTHTSVGTRRAARELIELDRRMIKATKELVASLRANPLVRDEMYERFLREDRCPICQAPFPDPYTRELRVLRYTCDRATHVRCMASWQKSVGLDVARCPICRANNLRSDVDEGYTLGEPIGSAYAAWDADLDCVVLCVFVFVFLVVV